MANLKNIFKKAALLAFNDIFNEAVTTGDLFYVVDDGFDAAVETSCEVKCIFSQFEQNDVKNMSFSELIQPTDVIALVMFDEVTVKVNTNGFIRFTEDSEQVDYTIEGFDLDPMNVLYTFLLRNN